VKVIVKVGGSILKDSDSFIKVARSIWKLMQRGFSLIVVVSAIRGFTDFLLDLVKNISPEDNEKDKPIIDEILSMGERLSARLLSLALNRYNIKTYILDPFDDAWPIITDDRYGEAEILFEDVKKRAQRYLEPLLERGYCVIIPGFIGKSKKGNVTTMGRNTSDVTASVLALALRADYLIYIKDRGGIVSNIRSKKRIIDRITLGELEELVTHGAKVLHPKALRYIKPPTKVIFTSIEKLVSLEGSYVVYDDYSPEVEIVKDLKLLTLIGLENPKELVAKIMPILTDQSIVKDVIIKDNAIVFLVKGYAEDLEKIVPLDVVKIVHKEDDVALIKVHIDGTREIDKVLRGVKNGLGTMIYDLVILPNTIKIVTPSKYVHVISSLLGGIRYAR